ncbi:MAG: alpha/beta hydrolase [Candidatus Limnocylindrales bacterium]
MSSTTTAIPVAPGLELREQRWVPAGPPRARILLVHGLGEHTGRYERTAGIMNAAGILVCGLDLRGFGASGGRRGHLERWDEWLDDLGGRLAALRAEAPALPVVLLGHSLGGLVCLSYAESERAQPDLLVLSSPALASSVPAWKQLGARLLGRVVPTLPVANGITGSDLSRDPAVGVDYVADPLNQPSTTAGLGRLILQAQERAVAERDRLRVPTLVTHGEADPLVPCGCSEILATLPGVDRRTYPELRHETLNEPEGPAVAADMVAWIEAHLRPHV